MLKVELHAHTDMDPADRIPHSTRDLIDCASSLGYDALAVTLHDRYFEPAEWADYARRRGIILLSGIERTIGRQHVLLINFPASCESAGSFDEIARLKVASGGLVIAPHPFFPTLSALRSEMDRQEAVIDAVEFNALFTRHVDFNRRAVKWARAHAKPLVGNSDVHLLDQLGRTYSLVDARPSADAICGAIRAGRVELRSQALSLREAASIFGRMLMTGVQGRVTSPYQVERT